MSVQITEVVPSVSTVARLLDQDAMLRQALHRHRQGQGDGGHQAFGDHCHDDADGQDEGFRSRQAHIE